MRRALIGVGLGLAAGMAGCDPAPEADEPIDPDWEAWTAGEDDALRALGEPILDCVRRDDTTWPVFHGCTDWHSAVHGVWALQTLSTLLVDDSYAAVADELLTPDGIAGELDQVEIARPFGEVPYGHAWLLRLAVQRAEAGDDDLLPLGEAAAENLVDWLDEIPGSVTDLYAQANDYDSSSWALFNLASWAAWVGDQGLAERVREVARAQLLPAECSLEREEGELGNFFPPCLHRALALLRILPGSERSAFLEEWLPDTPALTPITEPSTPHLAGLNFSRGWGLWGVYEATGDPRWRDLWLAHVQGHLARPEYWREDYDAHSHWIPQFGVMAIALSRDGIGGD